MPAVDQMINNGSPYADHGRLIAHCTLLFYAPLNPFLLVILYCCWKKGSDIIYLRKSQEDFANIASVKLFITRCVLKKPQLSVTNSW